MHTVLGKRLWTSFVGVACLATVATAWLVPVMAPPRDGNPFPAPIRTDEAIVVNVEEFASLPPSAATGQAAKMMTLVDEPGTGRLFVNDHSGALYGIGYDGRGVALYLDVSDPRWQLDAYYREYHQNGFHSFAFHPNFADAGTPGFGKLYTFLDVVNHRRPADFEARRTTRNAKAHTLLLEWSARHPEARRYEGNGPRELMRIAQPYKFHSGGHVSFRPGLAPGDPDFGMLYVSVADGGPDTDPQDLAQDLGRIFGKFLRIDPLGANSANGRYGIPADNPFADDGDGGTLGEIYAYGLRNPHRFGWDVRNGRLFVADIGNNNVEEISLVTAGANLGWNHWEGSYLSPRFPNQLVSPSFWLGAMTLTWPVVEYDHEDPLLLDLVAITGVAVYRGDAIAELADLVLFGDLPSGEIFCFPADDLPEGGQHSIRRVLLKSRGEPMTLLQMIRRRNAEQRRRPSPLPPSPPGWTVWRIAHEGPVALPPPPPHG